MDSEFIKWLAGMGGNGVIAALIFWFYRRDVRSYTELWEKTTAMLQATIKESQVAYTVLVRESNAAAMVMIKESTASNVANIETNREIINLLGALHRRLDNSDTPAAAALRGKPGDSK